MPLNIHALMRNPGNVQRYRFLSFGPEFKRHLAAIELEQLEYSGRCKVERSHGLSSTMRAFVLRSPFIHKEPDFKLE